MKKTVIVTLSLALWMPLSVLAGGHHKGEKCDKPIQECLNSMIAELKSTGFIGVEIDTDKETGTFKVTKIIEGTPAEKAGIQVGDVLFAIDGIKFTKKNHEAIRKVKKPGKQVTCTIKRDGANRELKMTLVPMPADLMAKYIGEHMMLHATQEGVAAKADK
jgi:C-terminal processing protease CtpA/Prc